MQIYGAQPGENLDYTLDLGPARFGGDTFCLQDAVDSGDAIASVSLVSRPSGAGEIVCTALTATGSTVTLWMSGGVAGRDYLLALTVSMISGRARVLPVGMSLSRDLASWPAAGDPPSWDFGAEIICMAPNLISQAYPASALLLATVPCTVRYVHAVATAVGGWLMLVDAAAVPTVGSNVVPALSWPLTPNTQPFDFNITATLLNGAVLLFTTSPLPNVYTASATVLLAGEVA